MGHLGEGALRRLRAIEEDYLASTSYGLSALKDLLEAIEGTGFVKDTDSLVQIKQYVDALEIRLTVARGGYLDNLNNANLLTIENRAWKKQAIAVLNQDPPVQNTWYDVLAATEDVRILFILIRQVNDETDTKAIEVKLTLDTVELTATITCNNNTWYYLSLEVDNDLLKGETTKRNAGYNTDLRAQSAQLEIRMTTSPGTTQLMDGRMHYETWEAT